RSIVTDAQRIGQAIALIQACQDPTTPAGVRVAIIGYSKGTISSRLYLRSRQADLGSVFPNEVALDPPGTNPVPEFVALAPPNHDCHAPPRKQAKNLGANAVNIAIDVPASPSSLTPSVDVHRNTVKHAEVICRALYTVVNHRAPSTGAASVCATASDGNPIVP